MKPKGRFAGIAETPGWLIDPNYVRLAKRMVECSKSRRDCAFCPYRVRCERWWDVVSGKFADKLISDVDYKICIAEFEKIRGNGVKP